jgi:cellulose synthase/poly-beta-1,6-N-acetylglucosamine synthase-like glycosyltransferase
VNVCSNASFNYISYSIDYSLKIAYNTTVKISILIPCYNEEKTIAKALDSCLNQSRPADEIVVVNDGSTDDSLSVLKGYEGKIKIIDLSVNTGNKSYAQSIGLQHVTGDVFITADADTLLDKDFIKHIELAFSDSKVMAVAGYVKSIKGNLITACRELEYIYGQEVHKYAQSKLDAIYVVPGCASAFRKKLFNVLIDFTHDTVTEDLDFTYQIHELGVKIKFCKEAIVYTQDPNNLKSYINQIRRWYGGGWQNLIKHWKNVKKKAFAFEIMLMFSETTLFGFLLLISPFINFRLFLYLCATSLVFALGMGAFAAYKRRRIDLLVASSVYIFMVMVNSYVFLEQMVKCVFLRKKVLVWYKPERRAII